MRKKFLQSEEKGRKIMTTLQKEVAIFAAVIFFCGLIVATGMKKCLGEGKMSNFYFLVFACLIMAGLTVMLYNMYNTRKYLYILIGCICYSVFVYAVIKLGLIIIIMGGVFAYFSQYLILREICSRS